MLRWIKLRSPAAALIGISLLMALAVIGTSLGTYYSVRHAARDLVRAQGVALVHQIRGRMRLLDPPVDQQDLELLLEELRRQGLRYLAFGQQGRVAAGTPLVTQPLRPGRGPLTLHRVGNRVRVIARGRRLPRWRRPDPLRARQRHRRAFSRRAVLEFEPTTATALLDRARRNAQISGLVAILVIALAVFAARRMRRERQLEHQWLAKRHLAALGEMSAVLAHEIRNPLASLKGHAQLLEEMLEAEGKEQRKAGRVVCEAERLETLVNELLEFVRTGVVERRDVDPVQLLREVAQSLSDRIDVVACRAPRTWALDPMRFSRALGNLLTNALQASSDPNARVEASVEQQRGALRFVVRDHGAGVPAGDEERIFEPFHTGRTRGTGLGLAVSRRIVEAHGGTIAAENATDGGARITVTVPTSNEAS